MNIRSIIVVLVLFAVANVFSQDNFYSSLTIPENLKKDANAVVRSNQVNILLKSSSEMSVTEKRIVTILNKQGDNNVDAYLHYDNNVNIKTLQVSVFDALGSEIKKIKKSDFKDVSAVDGGTLYSDSRVKFLEYIPLRYPYTIEFTSEFTTSNTAFIPSFSPIEDYFVSVENSTYNLNYPPDLSIRKKEKNTESFDLEKEETSGKIYYKVKNLEGIKPEDFGPSFSDIIPKILFASKQFTLEGVKTQVENWDDFAKWMYHDLIKDTHDLPASTVSMIQDLVKDEKSNIEKAKKIYQYVQDKTRYISVQVGIGGWKPFNASAVDKLGYGDCKALTNYTMSLLKAANVESNYCVVFGGEGIKSIENDFASMQGNHVFLNIPNNNENIWLECTSQKAPFGFIANGTDDRDVLVITPEGGKIVHTKKYETDENLQITKGSYTVSNEGEINASINVTSKGIQYNDKYLLESETKRYLDIHYKKRWKYINNMILNKMDIANDKNNIEFNEAINFNASGYSKLVGDGMLLTVNALNRSDYVPDRYRDRKLPLKIPRGFKNVDEIEIKLPENYKVESMPTSVNIENKFGNYQSEIIVKDESTLLYKRQFVINDGEFPKEDYDNFRNFYKEVAKLDNSKIALIKN